MTAFFNRVRAVTGTVGTGAITPGAAASGYRDFTAVTTGVLVPYVIEEGATWEYGHGIWNGTTLSRTVLVSSAGVGTAISLLGSAEVFIDILAEDFDLAFRGKNRLINPAFQFDQRNGFAGTATADDAYCFDRWYVLTQTASVSVSGVADPENGYTHSIRLTQSQAAAQRMGLAQIIKGKNCKDLRGKNGALSVRARISNSQAIRYAILGWTSTEDTVTSDVVLTWTSATYTAGNFFLASNVSVLAVGAQTPAANTWTTLDTLTTSLGTSFNNIVVFVWTEGTAAQNVTLDFDYIQFEEGSVSTGAERRLYEHENNLVQAYYTTGNFDAFGASGGYVGTRAYFKVRMHAIPTVTPIGVGGGNVGAVTYDTVTNDGFRAFCVASGSPANFDGAFTAVAEL